MLAILIPLPDPRDLTVNAVILTAAAVVFLCLLFLIAQLLFSRFASVRTRQQVNTALALAFTSAVFPFMVFAYWPGPWEDFRRDYWLVYFRTWMALALAVTSLAAAIDLMRLPRPSPVIGALALIAPILFVFYCTGLAVNNAFFIYFWSNP